MRQWLDFCLRQILNNDKKKEANRIIALWRSIRFRYIVTYTTTATMPFFLLKVRSSFCHQQFPLLWYLPIDCVTLMTSVGQFSLSIEIVTAECVCSAKMEIEISNAHLMLFEFGLFHRLHLRRPLVDRTLEPERNRWDRSFSRHQIDRERESPPQQSSKGNKKG